MIINIKYNWKQLKILIFQLNKNNNEKFINVQKITRKQSKYKHIENETKKWYYQYKKSNWINNWKNVWVWYIH